MSVGVDGETADAFHDRLDQRTTEIARRLARPGPNTPTAYRFGVLLRKEIVLGGKQPRIIYIPRIQDQLVYRILHDRLIEASQLGLPESPRRCVKRWIHQSITHEPQYVARLDIKSFFPSIPHHSIEHRLDGLPLHPMEHFLIRSMIHSTKVREPYDARSEDRFLMRGLPTGVSLVNPLAELLLDGLFEGLHAQGVFALRFVDDILLSAKRADVLESGVVTVRQRLNELGLSENKDKTHILPIAEPFQFLGFRMHDGHVLATMDRAQQWFNKMVGIKRQFRVSNPSEASAFIRALSLEITGLAGRHVPYYSMAENLSIYNTIDEKVLRLASGPMRRFGLNRSILARPTTWLWRYKKDFSNARARAERFMLTAGYNDSTI